MDWKLELVAVPVTDVDRAKAFYVDQVGFNADHDHQVSDEMRFVQLTPPGLGVLDRDRHRASWRRSPARSRACSSSSPTPTRRARDLVERGVEVGEVQEFPWGRFVFFSDPDGNGWAVQEIPQRG